MSNAIAGIPATISLAPVDAYGNLITSPGSDSVTAVVTPSGLSPIAATVTWNSGTSKWDITFTPTKALPHSLAIRVNTVLKPNLAAVPVLPGAAFASKCYFTTPSVFSGNPASFTIQAVDAYDNLLTSGGDTFSVAFSPAVSSGPSIIYNGNGQYTVTFTISGASSVTITPSLSGTNLKGAPLVVTVTPGPPSTPSTIVNVISTTVPSFSFQIRSQDSSGVIRPSASAAPGDDANAFRVFVSSNDNFQTAANLSSPVGSAGSAVYTVSGSSNRAATYSITAQIISTGLALANSPYTFTLSPAAAKATNCILSGDGLSGGVEATSVSFKIQAVDSYGNYKTDSSDTFSVVFSPSLSSTTSPLGNGIV